MVSILHALDRVGDRFGREGFRVHYRSEHVIENGNKLKATNTSAETKNKADTKIQNRSTHKKKH